MADLRTTDLTSNVMSLSQVKADSNELADKQRLAQTIIDNISAEIDQKGQSLTREKELKSRTDRQRPVCIRLEIAGPARLYGRPWQRELLDTMKAALVSIDQVTEEYMSYVFEHLETAIKSSSDEQISRVTEILQVTQLAVRDLLEDPGSRKWKFIMQQLDMHARSRLDRSGADEGNKSETQASVMAGPNLERESGHGEVNEAILNLKKEVKRLSARVQALED
ncbi:hypothetical protein KCU65_g8977, partial [Aureobasidium melanogenum]